MMVAIQADAMGSVAMFMVPGDLNNATRSSELDPGQAITWIVDADSVVQKTDETRLLKLKRTQNFQCAEYVRIFSKPRKGR